MAINLLSRGKIADECTATLNALSKSQAMIEFNLDGTVREANENFLNAVGYERSEVVGHHHRMFVDPIYAESDEYRAFWERLGRGEYDAAEYKRFGKGGREIWIQASYNPVLNKAGKPFKIVKIATDVTARKLANVDAQGQLEAISKAQAVIEFSLDGEVLNANENFCAVLGYDFSEIKGRHHRMFVEQAYGQSAEYKDFWERLRRGEFQSAEYKRIGKGGKEVWIQATYNPILDPNGDPFKVVKFATDITERKISEGVIDRLKKSLERMADGDLTAVIDTTFTGQYEELRVAFNHSLNQFAGLCMKLQETSKSLKSATGEILAGTNDLAERTTKQAAAIEETSAAMEQLSETVLENSKRADMARSQVETVAGSAEQGGVVMTEANEAMARITSSSEKISNIIGMIDDIAFQTNLLALNASVEAARAGDAGKGFAVVAVEVRRLAQSAANASSEVKVLIEQSASEVRGGSKLVSDATAELAIILDGIRENKGLINGIAEASKAQSGSIGEVNTAIREMDEMTQHNAALVEETNAAIEQTENQANDLDAIVSTFVLANTSAPVRAGTSSRKQDGPKLVKTPAKPHGNTVQVHATAGNAALKEEWDEF